MKTAPVECLAIEDKQEGKISPFTFQRIHIKLKIEPSSAPTLNMGIKFEFCKVSVSSNRSFWSVSGSKDIFCPFLHVLGPETDTYFQFLKIGAQT